MTRNTANVLSRIVGRGAIGIVLLVLAATPGVALAGEDDGGGNPPPVTDTQPTQPTPPTPVPVLPAPPVTQTPTPPAAPTPAPKPKRQTHKRTRSSHQTTQPVVERTTTVSTVSTADTQTIPQGGVQAGEGGTSQHGSSSALLGAGSGLLAFGIAAGVGARRRRSISR